MLQSLFSFKYFILHHNVRKRKQRATTNPAGKLISAFNFVPSRLSWYTNLRHHVLLCLNLSCEPTFLTLRRSLIAATLWKYLRANKSSCAIFHRPHANWCYKKSDKQDFRSRQETNDFASACIKLFFVMLSLGGRMRKGDLGGITIRSARPGTRREKREQRRSQQEEATAPSSKVFAAAAAEISVATNLKSHKCFCKAAS